MVRHGTLNIAKDLHGLQNAATKLPLENGCKIMKKKELYQFYNKPSTEEWLRQTQTQTAWKVPVAYACVLRKLSKHTGHAPKRKNAHLTHGSLQEDVASSADYAFTTHTSIPWLPFGPQHSRD